ncbi:hypothetical protein ACWEKM_45495 [Streptomyces sp. NPDC004752]
MTGPGFPCEPPPPAGPGTAAMRRLPATGARPGAGSPDDPREWALATHKPCPVDVCPAPVRKPQDIPLNSGEDVGAPPPHEAYANAPDLRREMHQLLALGAERDGRQARTVTVAPVDAAVAERAWLLRRAALMDRMALESPGPGTVGAAAQTAEQLLRHDRRRPDLVAGPYRPDMITPGPGCRRYVRQEYAAWTAAGRPRI